jgi:hypothetical protein
MNAAEREARSQALQLAIRLKSDSHEDVNVIHMANLFFDFLTGSTDQMTAKKQVVVKAAPYGFKKDGTPKRRPGRPKK